MKPCEAEVAVSDNWSNMCIRLIQYTCIIAILLECTYQILPRFASWLGTPSKNSAKSRSWNKLYTFVWIHPISSYYLSRSMCVHRLSFHASWTTQSCHHFISPRYRHRISCSCCATWKPTPLLAPVTTSRSTASVWGKRGISDLGKRSSASAVF